MKKYGISLLSAVILLLSFFCCRFVFFESHGMKSWPCVLLAAGILIIGISALFQCVRIPLFVSLGYPLSFAAGFIFQYDYADPTGSMTLNSMWIIWTRVYLLLVCAGIAAEVIARKRSSHSNR